MKKNVFARWFAVLIAIGVSTATLLLWRVLIAQQRPQIKQTIKLDAAIAKKPIAAHQESPSGSLIFAGSGGNLGSYPLVKTLSFVFLKDKLPSDAKTFLDFVQSKKGEKILRANGYLPG